MGSMSKKNIYISSFHYDECIFEFFFIDFLFADDELFLDDEYDDYEGMYAYGLHGPDIILL